MYQLLVSDVQGMNPMLLLPSLPSSAGSGNATRFSSAVPDLVLNLDVEHALLPQETVVYVPALKQGPATVGSEVLMRVGLAAALVPLSAAT